MAPDRASLSRPQTSRHSESSPLAKEFISDESPSLLSHETLPISSGHAETVRAILSRTAAVRSEGFLRPIADTPPTAPTSPRLGP
jgi:hypothetical protein